MNFPIQQEKPHTKQSIFDIGMDLYQIEPPRSSITLSIVQKQGNSQKFQELLKRGADSKSMEIDIKGKIKDGHHLFM